MEEFFETKTDTKKSLTIDWSTINNYKKEGSISGLCMALAESHKLLDYFLDKKSYGGSTIYEKVKMAKDIFSDINGLAKAMEVWEDVFSVYDKELAAKDVREAIDQYHQAITDIAESEVYSISLLDRMRSSINYYLVSQPDKFRKIVVWFLLTVILIMVLDNTHIGQTIMSGLVAIINFLFGGLLIAGLIILGIILIVGGVMIYRDRRKNLGKKVKKEEKKKSPFGDELF